ncbi:hypothetical protein [Lacinutrix sp. MEBiC02595]
MKRILFTVCFFALFFSCNSDDDNNGTPTAEAGFYALTVGNSWEYRYYDLETSSDSFVASTVVESVSIVSTEEIEGKTYFKFRYFVTGNDLNSLYYPANGESFKYLREDSDNLIDDNNTIIFLREDYEERLIGNLGDPIVQYLRLTEGTHNISTIAGTFETLEMELYARDSDGNLYPGIAHYYYADGIGMVVSTTAFLSRAQHFLEKRLESYTILN